MSEFACRNGHLMRSGEFTCKICGGRLHTMDGMTNRELEYEDRCDDGEDLDADEDSE